MQFWNNRSTWHQYCWEQKQSSRSKHDCQENETLQLIRFQKLMGDGGACHYTAHSDTCRHTLLTIYITVCVRSWSLSVHRHFLHVWLLSCLTTNSQSRNSIRGRSCSWTISYRAKVSKSSCYISNTILLLLSVKVLPTMYGVVRNLRLLSPLTSVAEVTFVRFVSSTQISSLHCPQRTTQRSSNLGSTKRANITSHLTLLARPASPRYFTA